MSWDFAKVRRSSTEELFVELAATQQPQYAAMVIMELHHRDAQAATDTMKNLTWAVAFMTLVNMLFVVLTWAQSPGGTH